MRNSPKVEQKSQRKRPPATTPEAKMNQMIALAVDVAEEQLVNRTASSQVVTHFLKLATAKEQLELEKLRQEVKLVKAKTDAIDSAKDIKELYNNAMTAFTTYTGSTRSDDDE